MKRLNYAFRNCNPLLNRLHHYQQIATRSIQSEQVYAICCQPELNKDAIFGRNVGLKTLLRAIYHVLIVEVANFF